MFQPDDDLHLHQHCFQTHNDNYTERRPGCNTRNPPSFSCCRILMEQKHPRGHEKGCNFQSVNKTPPLKHLESVPEVNTSITARLLRFQSVVAAHRGKIKEMRKKHVTIKMLECQTVCRAVKKRKKGAAPSLHPNTEMALTLSGTELAF